MPSLEEIEHWTIPEVISEIQRLLKPPVCLQEASGEGWYRVTILKPPDKPGEAPETLWTGNSPDRRLVLLNAFGWLWLRGQKTHHPAWKPPPAGQRPGRRTIQFPKQQDRPDHDPSYIRTVYDQKTKRK